MKSKKNTKNLHNSKKKLIRMKKSINKRKKSGGAGARPHSDPPRRNPYYRMYSAKSPTSPGMPSPPYWHTNPSSGTTPSNNVLSEICISHLKSIPLKDAQKQAMSAIVAIKEWLRETEKAIDDGSSKKPANVRRVPPPLEAPPTSSEDSNNVNEVPKDADDWYDLGKAGGGTVGDKHYTKDECFVEAIELSHDFSEAWHALGNEGGGTVHGDYYTEAECIVNADPEDADAWYKLGSMGGGKVMSCEYSPEECYDKAIRQNPHHQEAWQALGEMGGGTVAGIFRTEEECFVEADERNPNAWQALANNGRETKMVFDEELNKEQCLLMKRRC